MVNYENCRGPSTFMWQYITRRSMGQKPTTHTHTQSISVQCENDGTPQNRTSPATTTTTTSAISVKASTVATPPWAVLSEVAPAAI